MPALRLCIFDFDGLLVNSEDLYAQATDEVLRGYRKPPVPWEIRAKLQGLSAQDADRVFRTWLKDLPPGVTERDFLERTDVLQKRYLPSTRLLPGVVELVTRLAHTPNLHLAIASSSSLASFSLKTKHLSDFISSFQRDKIILGDDPRLPAGATKPAPDIYHLVLQTVNADLDQATLPIQPRECLVFEDSVSGVQAGLAAGMQVVWCPHTELFDQYYAAPPFAGAERVTLVRSLENFSQESLNGFNSAC